MKWSAMSPDSWKDLKKYSSTLMAGPVGSVADPDSAGSGLFFAGSGIIPNYSIVI